MSAGTPTDPPEAEPAAVSAQDSLGDAEPAAESDQDTTRDVGPTSVSAPDGPRGSRGRTVGVVAVVAAAAVIAVVIAAITASMLTRTDGTPYTGHDLSFRYPSTWHVQELPEASRSPGTDFELFLGPATTSGILISGSPAEPSSSEEETVASLIRSATDDNALLGSIGDIEVVEAPARRDVNGYLAVTTTVRASGSANSSTIRRVAIFLGDRRDDISCAFEAQDVEELTPGCDLVLDTLSLV
jgi:hypothetical protein